MLFYHYLRYSGNLASFSPRKLKTPLLLIFCWKVLGKLRSRASNLVRELSQQTTVLPPLQLTSLMMVYSKAFRWITELFSQTFQQESKLRCSTHEPEPQSLASLWEFYAWLLYCPQFLANAAFLQDQERFPRWFLEVQRLLYQNKG